MHWTLFPALHSNWSLYNAEVSGFKLYSRWVPLLDYCNSLLYKVPAVHMTLWASYNAFKIVLPGSYAQLQGFIILHPSYFLCIGYLLPTVKEFEILVLKFKAIYQLAPSYICNLVRLKEKCKYQLRSSEELLLQLPMGKTKKTLGDRSFQIAAPALWNSLPASVRDIDNFLVFKRTIKTYLFRKAFACYS